MITNSFTRAELIAWQLISNITNTYSTDTSASDIRNAGDYIISLARQIESERINEIRQSV